MKLLDTAGVTTLWGKVKDHVKTSIDSQQFKTINGTSVKGAGDIHIDLTLYKVVSALPTSGIDATKIYLVKDSSVDGNLYSEYMYVDERWEKLGSFRSSVDLEPYAKTDYVNTQLATKVDKQSGKGLSTNDFTTAEKNKLANISAGANNYSLPLASSSTLGGIKVSENADGTSWPNGTSWPICVDSNGLAYAKILGLAQVRGELFGIKLKNANIETSIGPTQISTKQKDEEPKVISIPLKSGTFAITSDCGLLVMNGGIVNNNIGFGGYKQNVLISASGNYNISNWYNSSPVGSVMDIYPYGDINGTITSDNKDIFQTMGISSSGLPIIVTKKSINLSNNHYIRLIHTSDGVYVCVSILGY